MICNTGAARVTLSSFDIHGGPEVEATDRATIMICHSF